MSNQEPQSSGDFFYLAKQKIQENKLDEARLFAQRAIAFSQTEKNELGRAMNLSLLGEIEAWSKHYESAFRYFDQAIIVFTTLGEIRDAGITRHQYAKFRYISGQVPEAGELFLASAQNFEQINDQATLKLVVGSFDTFVRELGENDAMYITQNTLTGFIKLGSKGAREVLMNILIKMSK